MSFLQIVPEKTSFLHEGQPFFYLADTVWSAFTNVTQEEWEKYLNYRKLQGFNVLQINLLHQWDASLPYLRFPFKRDERGSYSKFERDETYFDFAEKLLEQAVKKGLIPALVLLWCNFVPDTWASQRGISPVMPFSVMEEYIHYAVERFSRFGPIFVVSGDTNFGSQETVRYYLRALEIVKTIAPSVLTTMHLQPEVDLPEVIVQSPYLDFYMYQSGHRREKQHFPYALAQKFLCQPVKRPIVNGEPCYEGHPFGFTKEGSFKAFDVRKAIWQSLLSGACAGVTYGAHGIWCWHRVGAEFRGVEFSGEPFEWDIALSFQGAWDVAFAKYIFEQYKLFGLQPVEDVLSGAPSEIRFAITPDRSRFAIYSPNTQSITLKMNLKEFSNVIGINLTTRHIIYPQIVLESGVSKIKKLPCNSDVLFLGFC
ncbi:DUF4038 domain-containing protein [Candidatus Aerophobetes bacterium]|nr:DUF4038 domain-containing protein [Candidatus Aerophobetes bacterium]